jgi:hypothetical protein
MAAILPTRTTGMFFLSPDRWHFNREQSGFLIRVDKTTGKTERLVQNGWFEIGSNPPKIFH